MSRHEFEEIYPFGPVLLSCKDDTRAVQRCEPAGRDAADLVLAGAVGDHGSFTRQDPVDDQACARVPDVLHGPVDGRSGLNCCIVAHWS